MNHIIHETFSFPNDTLKCNMDTIQFIYLCHSWQLFHSCASTWPAQQQKMFDVQWNMDMIS